MTEWRKKITRIINIRYLSRLITLFRTEYKSYGWQIFFLGVFSFVSGILEGFGITAIIPIFSLVNKGKVDATDVISQMIEKFFSFLHLPYTLKFLLIFIFVVFIAKSALLFVVSHWAALITTSYEKKTRSEQLQATLQSDWPYLSNQKVGYLSQILNNDVANSSALLTYISLFLITVTNLIVYVLLMFNVSTTIAFLTVVFGIAIFFIFKPWLYKNKIISAETNSLYKDSAHYVDEVMIGSKAIKSMSLEESVAKKGYEYFEDFRSLTMRTAVLRNLTNALLQPLGLVLILAIFAYFYKVATLNFASFAVIVYAINKVFANIQIAQLQLHKISSTAPYLESIVEYKKAIAKAQEIDTGKSSFSFKNSIEFKDVSFGFLSLTPILDNLQFVIKKGEMTGIIGPSGSGKTTITDLLLRLFNPITGLILIDGNDIQTIKLSEWRTCVGYVSQDSFLINDTIENNIKFYNDAITNEAVAVAAKLANIADFINQLPDKYATVVGERGIKLSGGQRQRIVLARVLATKPEIIILDEATSALDNESERLIQESINGLKGSVTVVAIAHRLTTVMSASQLVVVENGKVIESGAPEDLLKNNGSYLSRVYNLR